MINFNSQEPFHNRVVKACTYHYFLSNYLKTSVKEQVKISECVFINKKPFD